MSKTSPTATVVKGFWIEKRGDKWPRGYKKRWLVLKSDHIAYYYENDTCKSLKGTIDIRLITGIRAISDKGKKMKFGFELKLAERVYVGAIDSAKAREELFTTLKSLQKVHPDVKIPTPKDTPPKKPSTSVSEKPILASSASTTPSSKSTKEPVPSKATTSTIAPATGKLPIPVPSGTEEVKVAEEVLDTSSRRKSKIKEGEPKKKLKSLAKIIAKKSAVKCTKDLNKDLSALKEKYPKFESLVEREWKECPKEVVRPEDVAERSLTVFSFNMLADGLSGTYYDYSDDFSKRYRFENCEKEALEWKYRGLRVVEEINRSDADVICLQECDAPDFIKEYLEPKYQVHWQFNESPACVHVVKWVREVKKDAKFDLTPDGVLIAFKRDKFKLLEEIKINKSKTDSKVNALALRLVTGREGKFDEFSEWDTNEVKDDRFEFIVCNTHLKASKDKDGETKRQAQIKEILRDKVANDRQLPIVITGDFNATPTTNRYGYESVVYPFVTKSLEMRSAYAEALGHEPEYTTHKIRSGHADKHTIDYIFFKDGFYRELNVTGYLAIPPGFGESPLPRWSYPSDHVSICARLTWTVTPPDDNVSDQALQTDQDGTKQTWPLPGQDWSHLKKSGNFSADLNALKNAYKKKYQGLIERVLEPLIPEKAVDASKCVSILQFNMLADGLTGGYIRINDHKSFLGVDKECLRWQYRGLRVIEVIRKHNPDILTIQECDHFKFLQEYLPEYCVKFQEKFNSPIYRKVSKKVAKLREWDESRPPFPMVNDGLVIGWKKELFTKVGSQRFNSNATETGLTGMAMHLEHKKIKVTDDNGKVAPLRLIVLTTHLKSTKAEVGEKIRVEQMKELFDSLSNPMGLPVLLPCDLNANPVVNKNGYEPWCYDAITGAKASKTAHGDEGHGYRSIYNVAGLSEPEYTTWKLRQHGTDKHTIDFVFLKGGRWKVVSHLKMPEVKDDSAKSLIPNWNYPSDHFPLFFNLMWDDKAPHVHS